MLTNEVRQESYCCAYCSPPEAPVTTSAKRSPARADEAVTQTIPTAARTTLRETAAACRLITEVPIAVSASIRPITTQSPAQTPTAHARDPGVRAQRSAARSSEARR